ncbi:MAG: hypothetical protein ACREAM_02780 [Blastocatellia bacterium]
MNDQIMALDAPNRVLDRECLVFSAYLVRQRPNEYVLAKYREAHDASGIVRRNEERFLDRLLVGVAVVHPAGAKLVDAYTAIFYKKSAVRRKWILLLAILESCAPAYRYFDSPDAGSRAWLAARLLWQGLGFILALGLSMILFTPAHLISVAMYRGR